MFYGQMITTIRVNGQVKSEIILLFVFTLSIPQKRGTVNIYDCFDEFTQNEDMIGENQWKDDGNKHDAKNIEMGFSEYSYYKY